MFANQYLAKQDKATLIPSPPSPETGIIVVIPCFYEPSVVQTLESLIQCNSPKRQVEVIILINHSETAPPEIKAFNAHTKKETDKWTERNKTKKLTFYSVGPIELKKKWAGAGLARKWGMDEAIRRFNLLENPGGILISLDADTLVDKNYFTEIEEHFRQNTKDVAATISFEHQKYGLSPKHRKGIELYEKYMDYYKKAIHYTGYPYSMFTVGSAFAVKAGAYVRRGGMNRRQAGEDFYFLQNLVQLGPVGEIKTTCVFPSSRLSARVPFGTGPILQKWMNGEEDLSVTYSFQAFTDLKRFFEIKNQFFGAPETKINQLISTLPEAIDQFLKTDNFIKELENLNRNCSTPETFQTRFFYSFNAFKILKYLNFAHEHFYKKEDMDAQFALLQRSVGTNYN